MASFQLLSKDEIETIHTTSINILENVGVEIDNENVSKILHEAGARVDFKKKLAFVPEGLIKEALKKVPSEVKLHGLDKNHEIVLARNNVYFNPGSTALYVLDRETMNMRRPTSKDFSDFVRLVDALEYIHAQSTAMVVSDVPETIADRYRLYIVLKHSVKPVVTGAFTIEGIYDMKHMLEIAMGDKEALRRKPCAVFDVCPSPPLKWSKITSQNLIDLARFNIPAEIIPMPQLGATGPVTLAGALAQHNAEFLSGLVISQLVNAGAPIIYGGSPSIMDMRHGTGCLSNIEVAILCVAYSQIAKFYGLPSHAYLGLSDTKTIDAQTGLESAIGIILGTLAGINNIAGPGMLGFENCQSFEKLVIDNEVCGMALRLARGITVNNETLAFDVVKKVGPGRHFLSEYHTRKWFQIEEYLPSAVIDKTSMPRWESTGRKDTFKRAKEQVDEILEGHRPKPLPPDVEKELDSFAMRILKKGATA